MVDEPDSVVSVGGPDVAGPVEVVGSDGSGPIVVGPDAFVGPGQESVVKDDNCAGGLARAGCR